MHGFNQGRESVNDVIDNYNPDVFLLQEHWLTPANLSNFDVFSDYFLIGSSAMSKVIESGILIGRPFGGVAILIKNSLRNITQTISCADRYVIVKIRNYLIVCVYLPCTGTTDRLLLCNNIFDDIWSWREQYVDCNIIIGGDFNVNLDSTDDVAKFVNNFSTRNSLVRCDDLFPRAKTATYINSSLNHQSCIDYILVSSGDQVCGYDVIDPDINYSDHLPLFISLTHPSTVYAKEMRKNDVLTSPQLRWDRADLVSYYDFTRCKLESLLVNVNYLTYHLNANESAYNNNFINQLHDDIVAVLNEGAYHYVPHHRKNFYKFWWDHDMDLLKATSIESNKAWKAAGKPRTGPIFEKRQSSRLLYRKKIRENQNLTKESYSNDLHDALLKKNGKGFWNCWNSKFASHSKCIEVDGCVDANIIVEKFADHFSTCYVAHNTDRANRLFDDYVKLRENYIGLPSNCNGTFDAELVGNIISSLGRGKAAGLDNLTAEHLLNSHPIISTLLAKLFNLMMLCRYVPIGFGLSYTVPIPKVKDCHSKALTCDDFRGIAISPILSKIFEHCLLEKFKYFLTTDDNQFGFKKGLGCSHAIYSVKNIVDRFIKGGYTANLCSIDLSKAFDKVNHHALFIKLMNRHLPVCLLELLEFWLSNSWSCIKWFDVYSPFFNICFGVRQGSVLSPFLFAVYLNDLVDGRYNGRHSFVILYADDILILTSSLTELQRLLHACEEELAWLDMSINISKSCCLRIGPRFDFKCYSILTTNGLPLPWATELRYLGVYILSSRVFKCSQDHAKRAYYRSLNAIFGKIGRSASEEVILQLVSSKCLPILLYASEACGLNKSDIRSLDFVVNRFLMKLFKTANLGIILDCLSYFNFKLPSSLLVIRTHNFLAKYSNCENFICKLFSNSNTATLAHNV
jgi:exonuclease III